MWRLRASLLFNQKLYASQCVDLVSVILENAQKDLAFHMFLRNFVR